MTNRGDNNDLPESQYELLFQESVNGIGLHEMLFDQQGIPCDYHFLKVNRAVEEMTGLQACRIIDKTALEVMPDLEKFWIEQYGKVVISGEPYYFEQFSAPLKKYFKGSAYRVRRDRFVVTFNDITELKVLATEMEQKNANMQAMFDSVQDGINIIDRDFTLVEVNKHFNEMYKNKEPLGEKCYCPGCAEKYYSDFLKKEN